MKRPPTLPKLKSTAIAVAAAETVKPQAHDYRYSQQANRIVCSVCGQNWYANTVAECPGPSKETT